MGDVTQLKSLEEKEREASCKEIQPFLEDLLERCKNNTLSEITLLAESSDGSLASICAGKSADTYRTLYHIQTSLIDHYFNRNIEGEDDDGDQI